MGVLILSWLLYSQKMHCQQGEAFQRYKAFAGDETNVGKQQESSKT